MTPEPAQPCGATLPLLRPTHWACDGTGLVSLMRGPGNRPVVIPETALDAIMARSEASAFEVEEFAGGDHVHMSLTWRELAS